MRQSPEKVRAFLIRYQDRVLYGTDLGDHARRQGRDRVEGVGDH